MIRLHSSNDIIYKIRTLRTYHTPDERIQIRMTVDDTENVRFVLELDPPDAIEFAVACQAIIALLDKH